MGQIVKAKKKGRPSKADLARRAAAAGPRGSPEVRRSLRRRSVRYGVDLYEDGDWDEDGEEEEEEEEEEDERRREKKMRLVLKLPPHRGGGQQRREASGGHAPASSSETRPLKKRKIGGADGGGDCDYDTEHGNELNEDEEEDGEDEVRFFVDLIAAIIRKERGRGF